MDATLLKAQAGNVLQEAILPELPGFSRGKVRDSYDLPDGRRVIIASDRLSAFDRVLAAIPFKGQVLTQTAKYQFEQTAELCPNHVLSYPDPNVVIGKRLTILPVEIVVRGYLAGTTGTSLLTLYKQGRREMYGAVFPDGLSDNQALPEPIITPTSKPFDGGHDEPMSVAEILGQGLMTEAQWRQVSGYALAVFARGQRLAADRGLILADTKYEFGVDEAGTIMLADEIHTPDSSRYWRADTYPRRFVAGERPDSFDKDFVRSWVAARCDPYRDEIPKIPDELIFETALVYVQAYETITGQTFEPPGDEPILERVRRNLKGI
jgi:phosphoribosylaminoimidazole-succinocarboxamide synthase